MSRLKKTNSHKRAQSYSQRFFNMFTDERPEEEEETVVDVQELTDQERLSRMLHTPKPRNILTCKGPLFEHFLVVGTANASSTKPTVLFSFPNIPVKFPNIEDFCFPEHVAVSSNKPRVFVKNTEDSYVFLLTNEHSHALYGVCVRRFEDFSDTPGYIPRMEGDKCFTPRCYCLISRYPFFRLHFDLINSLFAIDHLEKLKEAPPSSSRVRVRRAITGSQQLRRPSTHMTDSALTKQRTDGHVWQAGGPEVHQDSGGAATTRARGVSSPGCIRRSTTMPDISGCQEEVADGEDKDSRLDMDVAARRGSSNVAKFEVTDEDGNDQLLGEQDTTKPETVARVQETDLDEAPNPHITHVEGGAEKKCVLDSETVREDMQCSRTSNGRSSIRSSRSKSPRTSSVSPRSSSRSPRSSSTSPHTPAKANVSSPRKEGDAKSTSPVLRPRLSKNSPNDSKRLSLSWSTVGKASGIADVLRQIASSLTDDNEMTSNAPTERNGKKAPPASLTAATAPIAQPSRVGTPACPEFEEDEQSVSVSTSMSDDDWSDYDPSRHALVSRDAANGSPLFDVEPQRLKYPVRSLDYDDRHDSEVAVAILVERELQNNPVIRSLERYRVAAIPKRGARIHFSASEYLNRLQFSRPYFDEEEELFAEWGLPLTLYKLNRKFLHFLLSAILLEKQIILYSRNLRLLSSIVMSFVPLMRPFIYTSVMIPILPENMLSFLEAPVPFVVGVCKCPSPSQLPDDVILFDLNRCKILKQHSFPLLPQVDSLKKKLDPYFKNLRNTFDSTMPYSTSKEQLNLVEGISTVYESHFSSLFVTFHKYTIRDMTDADCPITVFHRESFLADLESNDRNFMQLFLKTQIFESYCDGRLRKRDQKMKGNATL